MTKANVLQIGLSLLFLELVIYFGSSLLGFGGFKAEVVSEIFLALILLAWILSYFFRVVTGKMTFMEQRKRYREQYEKITDREINKKFNLMSNDEKIKLINDLESNNNDS